MAWALIMSNCVINDEIFVHICDRTKTKSQIRCTKAFILPKVFQTADQTQYNCILHLRDQITIHFSRSVHSLTIVQNYSKIQQIHQKTFFESLSIFSTIIELLQTSECLIALIYSQLAFYMVNDYHVSAFHLHFIFFIFL